jgi:hypothetical protein
VLVSIPTGALAAEETLMIAEVDVANAPGTLPGSVTNDPLAKMASLTTGD